MVLQCHFDQIIVPFLRKFQVSITIEIMPDKSLFKPWITLYKNISKIGDVRLIN